MSRSQGSHICHALCVRGLHSASPPSLTETLVLQRWAYSLQHFSPSVLSCPVSSSSKRRVWLATHVLEEHMLAFTLCQLVDEQIRLKMGEKKLP